MSLKIISELEAGGGRFGEVWAERDGNMVLPRSPFRGKADNQAALSHGNASRAALHPYGDHPYGVYAVGRPVRFRPEDEKFSTFGPAFLPLTGKSGDAAVARIRGRAGLALHGGALLPDGTLRVTKGCGRCLDVSISDLADLVDAALAAVESVEYECRPK